MSADPVPTDQPADQPLDATTGTGALDLGDGMTFKQLAFSDLLRYRSETPTWFGLVTRLPFLPGLACVVTLRAQQRLFQRGHVRLAGLLRSLAVTLWSADLVPGMRVGPGLYLPHPMGVTIGNGLRVGAGVTILQGVTAGAREPGGAGGQFATIEDGAIISAHAVLLGAVTIGTQAHVGANSVVLKDVPAHAVVLGSPARKIGVREPGDVATGPA